MGTVTPPYLFDCTGSGRAKNWPAGAHRWHDHHVPADIDLVAVLRKVVEPCLSDFVRNGELKRGDVEELSLAWRDERMGPREVRALVLGLTISGEVFTFYVVTADAVNSYDSKTAADGLEERLAVFIADVIGRPTRSDFR
jgi:hypothetical protein